MTEQIRINKVALSKTLSGKPVAHLHAPGAQYAQFPALYLFDLSLLASVGIDPNSLTEAPTFVNLWAHYEVSEKLTSEGNHYKDVVSLERIDAPATTTSTDTSPLLAELRAIKALLLELVTGSQPPTDTEQARRIHAVMSAGRTGSPADPQATEPVPTEPELSEAEARTEFYTLAGPAIAEGQINSKAVNHLTNLANGDGWNTALAGLRDLLAK